ncbi:nucleotide disphospho-sugar-binding domain-containing protein [Nocardia tengchongensis]|uniref:glycosyltransferase n=1 Tax=Nocardia tengchongensis TaxID=2055889 RepID=UPI0033C7920D
MRLLFASLATVGHAYPLVPLAIAARRAGCEVHFAAGESVHPALVAHGLRPFRPADCFSEIYPEDLAGDLERLRPDLVIHEWGVPGAAIAARRAGIPGLWHGFGRMFPDGIGLESPLRIPEVAGLPHLDICPPALQDKDFLAADRIPLRPIPYPDPFAADGPPELPNSRPLIYLTLGTVFGTPELLTTAIAGLARLDARIIVATGRLTPSELGPLPENVTIHAWVPQTRLLPHTDVVIHHGGSGTTLAALNSGVPQLLLPQGADQFANADALAAAGAAIQLRADDIDPGAIADAAARLLPRRGNDHRDAARAIAAEIAAMPDPETVVGALRAHADGR